MSANIAKTVDGRDAVMMVGTPAWHGLGQVLSEPQTSHEAMKQAGLDWTVEKRGLVAEKDQAPVNGFLGLQRSDTKEIISVVGDRYRPIQNSDAFSFMDSIVGGKHAMYHTAGALGMGERVWMLAKLPGTLTVKGVDGDQVEKFLILVNSHDGTSSLRCFFSGVRIVCQNTLNMALGDAKDGIAIRHTKNAMTRVDEAKKVLGIAHKFYDDFQSVIDRLASKKIGKVDSDSYLKLLLPDNRDDKKSTRRENIRAEMLRLSVEGAGNDMPGIGGTMWALYNGVTEYVDHARATRGTDDSVRAKNRLNSVWFGSGARLKQKALDLALQVST